MHICTKKLSMGRFWAHLQSPLESLRISPVMTRGKTNAKHRRVIIDLSFPHGQFVNAGVTKDMYLNTPFTLKLPTIDHITDQVKALRKRL